MASMARETTAPVSTWRDAVLGDGLTSVGTSGIQPPAAPGSFVRAPSPKPSSRCSTSMVLAHSVDLIVLALFAAVAALLRFGDFYLIRPQLRGLGGLCNVEDYFLPLRESTVDLPPYSIYILVILAPIVLAVLLEFALAFALRRQILRAQAAAGSWKTFFYKRAAKTLLVLLLGLCLTSTITDVLRLLVSRPRPYFLSQGQAWGRYCNTYEDATISSEERDARLSFPSHRCSMLAYAGGVVALHAELVLRRLQAGGIYVLRVVVLLVATMPALLVASQCFESRSNHWQDVVVGLLLGTLLAVYVELVLGSEMVHEARVVASTPLSDTGRRGQFLPRLRTPRGPSTAPSVEDINNVQPHLRPPHIFKGEDAFF